MPKRAGILFLLFVWLSVVEVPAEYRFDVWTTEDGLPQNSITDIWQTRDGYLWLATFDALVRYDGVRFKSFNTGNTKGLKGVRFTYLYEDAHGRLWIGTEKNGLVRYENGAFTTFTIKEGLINNTVDEVLEDAEGNIYAWFYNGITVFRDDRFVSVEPPPGMEPYQVPPGWFIDRNGMHKLKDGQEVEVLPLDGTRGEEIVRWMRKKYGWIFTDKTGTKQLVEGSAGPNLGYATGSLITRAQLDARGNYWLASGGAGLFRIKDGLIFNYTTADGLPDDQVYSVREDREGNVWVGTSKGLGRVTEKLMTSFTKLDGLASDNVYPIMQDSRGAIWIGSWTGLTKFENGIFVNVGARYELGGDLTRSIHEDREGNIWIGSFDGGLRKISNGVVTTYRSEPFFYNSAIHSILQDRSGVLWFGTENGLVKRQNETFSRLTVEDGLPGKSVNVLFEDSRGTLWLGTEQGLAAMSDGKFKTYGENEGLSGYIVRAIYEDSEGTFWIGTYDGGLNRLKDGKITSYTTDDGLFNNGVFQILEDKRGEFWMSSNLGIYRVNRHELNDFAEGKISKITSVSYGKSDGMPDVECNGGGQPAGLKAADGRFWFPTQKGVVVFDPEQIRIVAEPPPVKIEEITVNNEPTVFDSALKIPSDEENFQISYTGLSFILPEQIKFRYKLDGLDSDWVYTGTRRTVYFSHLAPGEYVFNVTAANRDGVWNPNPAQLHIVVAPQLWQTTWFRVLAFLLTAGVILFIYRRRVASLRRATEMQRAFSERLIESQETERKRIAAELHDSLSQNLVVIKNRVLLARRTIGVKEKAIEQLDEISAATEEAIDEVSEISYNLRPYQLDKLGLSKAIESMLKKVSSSSGIQFTSSIDDLTGAFTPEAEINFYRVVQESVNNILKHSDASRADVIIKRAERTVFLTISDNGKGFDPEARPEARRTGGFGLVGMAERARILGGKYSVRSSSTSGTTVTLDIALTEKDD